MKGVFFFFIKIISFSPRLLENLSELYFNLPMSSNPEVKVLTLVESTWHIGPVVKKKNISTIH